VAETPTQTLARLLEESGAKVTFSKNCCSGIVSLLGPAAICQCWRCRESRGQTWNDSTEASAAEISARAQMAMRDRVRAAIGGEPTEAKP
jgi:hypothetical protein